jgi:hypothetical protein
MCYKCELFAFVNIPLERSTPMAGLSGTLLALLAGALCYLASPRQRLLRVPMHLGVALALAAAGLTAAAWLWSVFAGVAAGICATVCAFAMSLALMPFLGVWWQHDVHRTRRKSSRGTGHTPPSSGPGDTAHRAHAAPSSLARPAVHSSSDGRTTAQRHPHAEIS